MASTPTSEDVQSIIYKRYLHMMVYPQNPVFKY